MIFVGTRRALSVLKFLRQCFEITNTVYCRDEIHLVRLEILDTWQPMNEMNPYAPMSINLENSHDPEFPYQVVIDNKQWVIRINDFPEEALYTLMVDGKAVIDFSDWPYTWKRQT